VSFPSKPLRFLDFSVSPSALGNAGVTFFAVILVRSAIHCSSLIGLSPRMYTPSSLCSCCTSRHRSGLRFFNQNIAAVVFGSRGSLPPSPSAWGPPLRAVPVSDPNIHSGLAMADEVLRNPRHEIGFTPGGVSAGRLFQEAKSAWRSQVVATGRKSQYTPIWCSASISTRSRSVSLMWFPPSARRSPASGSSRPSKPRP
jgi:hypothetical protein